MKKIISKTIHFPRLKRDKKDGKCYVVSRCIVKQRGKKKVTCYTRRAAPMLSWGKYVIEPAWVSCMYLKARKLATECSARLDL